MRERLSGYFFSVWWIRFKMKSLSLAIDINIVSLFVCGNFFFFGRKKKENDRTFWLGNGLYGTYNNYTANTQVLNQCHTGRERGGGMVTAPTSPNLYLYIYFGGSTSSLFLPRNFLYIFPSSFLNGRCLPHQLLSTCVIEPTG